MSTPPAIVITGASTGIGYAIAERFAREGWRVFAGVRKQQDADRLQRELKVTPLILDVADPASVEAAAATVSEALQGTTLAGLVNNAGIAVGGPLLYVPEDQMRLQFEVNVLGPARVTRAFAPLLGADRSRTGAPGRIAQMSSIAGRFAFPFMGPYSASKHALEGMSEALRRELMLFGIAVSIIAPGPIVTPIWDKALQVDPTPFVGTEYEPALRRFLEESVKMGRTGLPASRVADAVWHAMTASKPKLRYVITPDPLRQSILPSLVPSRLTDYFVAKALGLRRR